MLNVEAERSRKRLRPVMEAKCRQMPPRIIAAQQLDQAGEDHQPEQQPPQQPDGADPGGAVVVKPRMQTSGGDEQGHRRRLEKKDVPLVIQKHRSGRGEGKVQSPQSKQRPARGDPECQQDRKECTEPAEGDQKRIAGVQPEETRKLQKASRPGQLLNLPEILPSRPDAVLADQRPQLNAERGESDQKNQSQRSEEEPSAQDVARSQPCPPLRLATSRRAGPRWLLRVPGGWPQNRPRSAPPVREF